MILELLVMAVSSNVTAQIIRNAIILMANVNLVDVQLVTREIAVKKVKSNNKEETKKYVYLPNLSADIFEFKFNNKIFY